MLYDNPDKASIHDVLLEVDLALREKNYNPINQIVGYLLTGDPAYITSHRDARNRIRQVLRNEVLDELVSFYLKNHTRSGS
ncbi:MAG: IreB family regulatory phosphoprotein [Symbiobacteriaceae bacterium]|nr:IreB family regulatory phosphoprotein [Symbiobacteriaceae bacterium]